MNDNIFLKFRDNFLSIKKLFFKNYHFLHFFLRRRFRFYYLYLLDHMYNKSINNTNYLDIYSNLFSSVSVLR